MNAFTGLVQRFGLGRLVALLGVSAGVAAALFAIVLHLGNSPKALLYSNLDLKEAGSITAALDQAAVKYEVKGDGSTIMVERDKVASTRLLLSGKGLPTSGSVGYELFDNAPALGQTAFVQNLNQQRALEGELARTVRSLQGVSSARVHLVLPKRELFEEDAGAPTASVVIGAARTPDAGEVQAIRNLIAGAVPNLKPERVTVVDDKGRMLAGGDGEGMADQMAQEQRNATEDRVRKTVLNLVEGVVGAGKARVQVTADLDLARVTTQEETFDPDGQVVRSTQTAEEKADENKPGSSAVSAAQNIPGADAAVGAAGGGTGSTSGKTEETTNYEISKKTRTEVVEPGAVKRMSVAVAVDGVTIFGKKGETSYAPRSADEMKRIESLVRSAVGFDQQRGDQLTVVNVRFDRGANLEAGTKAGNPLFDFDKNDMMRGVEVLVLFVVGLLMIFFVARPLMKRAGGGGEGGLQAMMALPGGQGGVAYASAGGQQLQIAVDPQTGAPLALPPGEVEQRINIAKIEGQVKASSVKQVAEFVEKHPDESVSILRSWLHESA